ncbi:TRAP transporter small permease [Chloroflexota bacterium]
MKLLTKFNAVFDRVLDVSAILTGLLIVFIMVSTNSEIISRKLLNASFLWVVPYSEYSLAYIVFLGTAWLLKREGHVRIDIVLNWLNPRQKALLNAITSIITAILCLIIAYVAVLVTWDIYQRGVYIVGILETPKAPLLAIIPVGFLLLFIQFLRRTYENLRNWRAPRTEEQGLGKILEV